MLNWGFTETDITTNAQRIYGGRPAGWICTQPAAAEAHGKTGAWYDTTTGWRVSHCGHPTALWPYTLHDPAGRCIVAHSGRGFTHKYAAMMAVKFIDLGGIIIVDDPTRPGLGRCEWQNTALKDIDAGAEFAQYDKRLR